MTRGAAALGAPPLVLLCETLDCGRYAGHVVSYDGLRKKVCRRCRDELVALWGWRLER